jgi:hypothetical protein
VPKINWGGADEDELITVEDIETAEEGYAQYVGDMPPGGVYRFMWRRAKYQEFSSGNQGLNVLLLLDGSWKPGHKKYDGCPLWDRVVMTKASSAFVKAFTRALGVSAEDLLKRCIVDEDNIVTKIGKKTINEDIRLYVAVRVGEYNDTPRLEISGTGYQVVEAEEADEEPAEEAKPAAKGKATKAAKGKAGKSKADDDEPPF